jgi:putative lipoic acid-binding regulatory protein
MTEQRGDAQQPAGLTFPGRHPVKVMIESGARSAVLDVVSRHAEICPSDDVRTRPSRSGRYESITVTVDVQTRDQLEALYADLQCLDAVRMML